MATTFFSLSNSPQTCKIRAEADGAGPAPVTLTNAQVLALMFGNGLLRTLWSRTYADQAAARAALMNGVQAEILCISRAGAAVWRLDVDVDGNNLPQLIIDPSAVTSTAIITLREVWSAAR